MTRLLVLAALAACRPAPADPPICPAYVAGPRAAEADTRTLPPAAWLGVLLPDAARMCSGDPLALDHPPAAPPLAPRRPVDEDMTFGKGPKGQLIVWARARRFADGTALGPVALVRWVERGLEVRGIGPLAAPERDVRLRLERLGPHRLLVADGERCPAPATCTREFSLLPLVGQRFIAAELVEGEATGPARLLAAERREARLADGWIRRAEVSRALEFEETRAVIRESIRVRDCDPHATPPLCHDRLITRDERPLRLVEGRLVAAPSAWADLSGGLHD